MSIAQEKCTPCRDGQGRIEEAEARAFLKDLPGWTLVRKDGVPALEKAYKFDDFLSALDFANRVGREAEAQDHHPALTVEWGRVTAAWWTHKVKGLHRNDFVMAARTDALFAGRNAGT
jgi:4a-hydroxytetrahydrobiopterin dehydratase